MLEKVFKTLHLIFSKNGHNIYAVGGTVRDFLLHKAIKDYDFVTDATPEEMRMFIEDGDFTFSKYGVIKYCIDDIKIDIVTLREEYGYQDERHPNSIKFIKDLYKDSSRRDFTINAMYLDNNFNIIDYWNGREDLSSKVLRCIGDPFKRLKEDPLRILRALRFAGDLDLKIEPNLDEAIKELLPNIRNLKVEKVKEEWSKFSNKSLLIKYKVEDYLMKK